MAVFIGPKRLFFFALEVAWFVFSGCHNALSVLSCKSLLLLYYHVNRASVYLEFVPS